ncbi:PAS domain-containing protein [Clostridium sp.]|uniref:sensor histidine kinase n=1 Tax=Clostridium sp. TaxID=1506 RepID=UPI002FC7A625
MYKLNAVYHTNKLPFIVTKNEMVVEVSQEFCDFTEYLTFDFINENIIDVFKTLRVGPNINILNIDKDTDYFLFTKSLEIRIVTVNILEELDKKIYVFIEDTKSRFEDKLNYFYQQCSANINGMAIYSCPDLILLKANQRYLDYFDIPYNCPESTFGKTIWEFTTGFKGSSADVMWKEVAETGEPKYIKELKYDTFARGVTYWDIMMIPIKEDGNFKYIINNAEEVTDRVIQRKQLEVKNKIIEKQKKEIQIILDHMNDGVTLIDKDGKYLLVNKKVQEWMLNPVINNIGDVLENVKHCNTNGEELTLAELPGMRVLKGEKFDQYDILLKSKGRERCISISGTPICDKNGKIIMGVLTSRDTTERVEHLKLIENQKVQLETIMDNISDLLFAYDSKGNHIYMNKAAARYFNEDRSKKDIDSLKELEYLDFNRKLIPKENMAYSTVLRTKKPDNRVTIMKKGEEEFYLQVKTIPLLDNTGNISMIISFATDVTEHIKCSKLVQEQKEKLEAIIENMSEAIVVSDKEGKILKINAETKKLFYDMEKASVLGETFKTTKYFDTEGRELSYEDMPAVRALRGEKVKSARLIVKRPDKELTVDVNSTPVYDMEGNISMTISSCRDVTEVVKNNEIIRNQKKQLDAIISSMSDGLKLVDNNYKITFLNQSAKDFFNNSEVGAIAGETLKCNKYYYDIDGEEMKQEDLPSFRVINKGSFQNYILTIQRPDKKMYISVNGSSIHDDGGKVKEAVLCVRDITKQVIQEKAIKYHQEAALQAQCEKNATLEKAMEMKDEFLSLISHEFRTPLNVISAAIQGLNFLYSHELSDKVKEYLATIRQNTFRQLRLVNNLLDITRADAGRIKIHKRNIDIVFLTRAITESVNQYASQKGIKITFETSFEKIIVGIDDEKYERILLNLLSNAIKFTPEGKEIIVNLCSIKDNIAIEVRDYGLGIPEDKTDIIFERFGQVDSTLSRQAEGAGIGLSLVKKLVEAFGGNISVKSKVGKGSTFIVTLPNEMVAEDGNDKQMTNLMDNRLVQVTTVEFSDIYL